MLSVEEVGGISVVRVFEDVNIASAPKFEAALNALHDQSVIVIDLRYCPYFDSTGLSVLYRTTRETRVATFMPLECNIRKIFDIVRSSELFQTFETEADALQYARDIASAEDRSKDIA